MFGPKKEAVIRGWQTSLSGTLDEFSAPNTFRVKLRGIRWAGHVAAF
jgi:hypothetical protein